jgi:hypothetical protein
MMMDSIFPIFLDWETQVPKRRATKKGQKGLMQAILAFSQTLPEQVVYSTNRPQTSFSSPARRLAPEFRQALLGY